MPADKKTLIPVLCSAVAFLFYLGVAVYAVGMKNNTNKITVKRDF